MASSEPTRAELLAAREQLKEQILRVKYPVSLRDQNPGLLARLEATLADINDAIAASGAENA